ncbi:MAG: hypothetical protein V4576_03470 [Patescibacteria group bacterium]
MQSNNNSLTKKIIVVLIVLVIGVGIYFGIKFYQSSKNVDIGANQNTDKGTTPFQTRTATSGEVVVVGDRPNTPGTATNPSPVVNLPMAKPRLVQLWKEPVSGFDFVYKDREIVSTSTATTTIKVATTTTVGTTTATTTINVATTSIVFKSIILKNQTYVYLWDRATGNIHQNLASTTEVERLSNYTLPRIEEAYFIDPLTVLVRGLDESNESVRTTYLQLIKETSTSTLFTAKAKNIPVISKVISLSNETKKMFYFIEKTGQGIVSNLDISSFIRVINTSLTQLLPQYVNKTLLAATTRPSAYFPGYLFFINSGGTGSNEYILGEKYGFTTLVSPDGKKVLYSEIKNDLLQTAIYDVASKTTVFLDQSTITEKCVWTSDSKQIYCAIPQKLVLAPYPDQWYQGLTAFSDNIWSVNPSTGEFAVVVPLQDQLSNPVDAFNLKISADKKYLLFQDKYSLTLWKYDL